MQKIIPHLWYDTEAKEAAELYVSAFGGDSKVIAVHTIHDTPSGDADMVSFELHGYSFMAISAGPVFKLNPSISFQVKLDGAAAVDSAWAKLVEGGTVLMPLGSYPFSEHYGWVQDTYGASWQLMTASGQEMKQHITPVLMLAGQEFGVMDSAREHAFAFNEAISFVVPCDTQDEIDYYWEKLSAVPEAEQCGWLKDTFGVSWQITPAAMGEMMAQGTPEQLARVTQTFLKMKKFDVAALDRAYRGE